MAEYSVTISIGSIFLQMKTPTDATPLWSTTANADTQRDPRGVEATSNCSVNTPTPPKTIDNFVNACASFLNSTHLNPVTDRVTLTFSPGDPHLIKTRVLWMVEAKGFETTVFLLNQFQIAVTKERLTCHYSTLYTRWVTIDVGPFNTKIATIKTSGKMAIKLALLSNADVTSERPILEIEYYLRQQLPPSAIIYAPDIRSTTITLIDIIARGTAPMAAVTMLKGTAKEMDLILTRDRYEQIFFPWGATIRDLLVEACGMSDWYPRELDTIIIAGAASTHSFISNLIEDSAPLATIFQRERSHTLEAVETLKLAYTEGQGPVIVPQNGTANGPFTNPS